LLRLLIPQEFAPGEKRVAATPETVRRLSGRGAEVHVELGAGAAAGFLDADFAEAGAQLHPAHELPWSSVEGVLCVAPPAPEALGQLNPGTLLVGLLAPYGATGLVETLNGCRASAIALELLPRISRAQAMDVLSSQANIAGYKAVLLAAAALDRYVPMLMTAAGTVKAARVVIMGVGVAGLQAIATAKRLGAVVEATDVRPETKEQVESLGAKFIDVPLTDAEKELAKGQGGYARDMGEDRAKAQQDALKPFISESDVVITTAAIPGRKAPLLVTASMVENMKPGSVIVDLAAESGGNVEGSIAGQDVLLPTAGGDVTVIGCKDLASQLSVHSSKLYAQNVVSLLTLITTEGEVNADPSDEVVAGSAVVFAGDVRNAMARETLGLQPLAKDGE
ncbi:MAG: NAD(P) transhydrogenase subunit alpha, partial [Planctomycetota bacterium]